MNGVGEGFGVIGVIVAVGYLVGRAGVLGEGATAVLSRTAFWVGAPALLFTTIAEAPVAEVFSPVLLVIAGSAVAACLLGLGLAALRRRPPGDVVVASMASGYVNAGNLGIPIAVFTLGGPAAIAPALIAQLALLTPVYTTLLDVVSARDRGEPPSVLRAVLAPARNPLAIATALGLASSLTGVSLPSTLAAPVGLLADLAVPAMLLAFGVSLVTARLPGRDGDPVVLAGVVALKCLVHPAIALAASVAVGLGPEATLVAVVSAALPTAQNVFGYAVRFDEGVVLARDVALVTTVVSVPVLVVVVALLS